MTAPSKLAVEIAEAIASFAFDEDTRTLPTGKLAALVDAKLAPLVEDGARLQREGDRLEWVHDNCRVVYYPPDGSYPYEHSLSAKKQLLPEIIRRFADPEIDARAQRPAQEGSDKQ